jgi:hypothetical protein
MLHAYSYCDNPSTAAKLMLREHETVGVALIVVVRNVENVVAVRPVDLHRVLLVGRCLRVAATLQSSIISLPQHLALCLLIAAIDCSE